MNKKFIFNETINKYISFGETDPENLTREVYNDVYNLFKKIKEEINAIPKKKEMSAIIVKVMKETILYYDKAHGAMINKIVDKTMINEIVLKEIVDPDFRNSPEDLRLLRHSIRSEIVDIKLKHPNNKIKIVHLKAEDSRYWELINVIANSILSHWEE